MALIRNSNSGASLKDAIVMNLGDLSREAESLVARAQTEAARIVAEAEARRAAMLETAGAEGFARGHAEGLARGSEEGSAAGHTQALAASAARLAELDVAWCRALASFAEERGRLLADARADVVRLAVMLAEKLTKRRLEIDPTLVIDQVSAVIRLIARPSRLTVRVHPADEALVREALPGLLASLPLAEHVGIVSDPALARGSCVATTAGGGVVDASITGQLDRIASELLPGRLEAEGAGRAA